MEKTIFSANKVSDISSLREEFLSVLAELEEAQRRIILEPGPKNLISIDDAGEVIKDARKKQNLSIADLANLTGMAFSTIQKIETSGSNPRVDTLKTVLGALGLKLWIG